MSHIICSITYHTKPWVEQGFGYFYVNANTQQNFLKSFNNQLYTITCSFYDEHSPDDATYADLMWIYKNAMSLVWRYYLAGYGYFCRISDKLSGYITV